MEGREAGKNRSRVVSYCNKRSSYIIMGIFKLETNSKRSTIIR
jgi:hypothetical protein